MNLEEIIIAIIRIIGSLPVLFSPFFGGLAVIAIDLSDLFFMQSLQLGGVSNYQQLDKILDCFYLLTFLLVSRRWDKTTKNILLGLFVYRIIGMVLFEIFSLREILFFFPNFFEFAFIFFAYKFQFNSFNNVSRNSKLVLIAIIGGTKIIHEYILHVWQELDNYTAMELLRKIIE
jgi:hypothetical protein|tara:strand:- start:158 stop:682 length:525 start_codon:yes stop_codon:yes gene_type:complete